ELDVAHVVAPELDVHEPRHLIVGGSVAVVLDALDQAARAVADTGDRDANGLAHRETPSTLSSLGTSGRPGGSVSDTSMARSASRSSSTHSRSRWMERVR